jgi:hypothetical protein
MGVSWRKRLPSAGWAGSGPVDIEVRIRLDEFLGHTGLDRDGVHVAIGGDFRVVERGAGVSTPWQQVD